MKASDLVPTAPLVAPGQLPSWLEHASNWIHVVSARGELLGANRAWRDALGIGEREVVGLNVLEVLAPPCRVACASALEALLRGEHVPDHVVTFVTSSGTHIDVEGRASLISEPGAAPAVLGMFRPLAGAECAVDPLVGVRRRRPSRDCEERFFRLVEAAQDAIAEFDEAGRCVYASDQHRELLGVDPSALLDRSLADLVHPDDLATVTEDFRVASDTGRPGRSLVRFRHASGEARWFESTGSWFTTASGERRLVTVSRDVSDRILSDAALRRSEARYRAILENSLDMISIVGADGTVTFQDTVAGSVLGYDLAGIGALQAVDFVHPDDQGRAWQAIQDCVADPGALVSTDLRVRHANGSWRWVRASGRNLVGVEGVDGIMITSRDVTEQRALEDALARREAELHQAQKMEALGRLAGGVAHDFNNLLSVIGCNAELIVGGIDDPASAIELATGIREAGERAAGLTRQLLAFSRKQTVAPQRLDLNAALRNLGRMLQRVIGEDIRLVLDLAEDVPTVSLDPTQLDQVIMNLAVNARDAMPTGGGLTISTRSLCGAAPRARLTVRDTGHGMDPDTLAHVFEPFFTTKPQHKGTGLGLSMVYGVVLQAGGSIAVDSAPGQGACFILDFPSVSQAAAPTTDGDGLPSARVAGAAETILLVEDDSTVRSIVQRVLEMTGYRVTAASSRSEALALCGHEASEPDLMLSDVILPDGSGPALVHELRTRWPQVRVLLMSGYVGEMLDERGLESCSADFIAKPFSPDSLLQAVQAALGRT